jgi:hypothetical protein
LQNSPLESSCVVVALIENYSTSKPLNVSREKSQIFSCDTVVANERYVSQEVIEQIRSPILNLLFPINFFGLRKMEKSSHTNLCLMLFLCTVMCNKNMLCRRGKYRSTKSKYRHSQICAVSCYEISNICNFCRTTFLKRQSITLNNVSTVRELPTFRSILILSSSGSHSSTLDQSTINLRTVCSYLPVNTMLNPRTITPLVNIAVRTLNLPDNVELYILYPSHYITGVNASLIDHLNEKI